MIASLLIIAIAFANTTVYPLERNTCVLARRYTDDQCTILHPEQDFDINRPIHDSTCRKDERKTCKVENGALVPDRSWTDCHGDAYIVPDGEPTCVPPAGVFDDSNSCPHEGIVINTTCTPGWGGSYYQNTCEYCDTLECEFEFGDGFPRFKANPDCYVTTGLPEEGERHCVVAARYSDPLCTIPRNYSYGTLETWTTYDDTCRKTKQYYSDPTYYRSKAYCTRDANNNVLTGKVWGACTTTDGPEGPLGCDDGEFSSVCPTEGRELGPWDSVCKGIRDTWTKVICVPCSEMPCQSKMQGSRWGEQRNLNPDCPGYNADSAGYISSLAASILGLLLL